MASTLWRNAFIAARSRVYPPGARYRQRQRLTQHNTEMTPLFRLLRLRGGQPGPGADLGCTGWEGWCTSRPVSWISGVLSKPKFAGEGAPQCCELRILGHWLKVDRKPDVAKVRSDAGQARSDSRGRQQPPHPLR